MTEPTELLIPCPACGTKLRTPESALGLDVFCSQCQAPLRLPTKDTDGKVGEAVRLAGGRGRLSAIPPRVLIPMFGLLLLGFAGLFVNGYLYYLTSTQPGADLEIARKFVEQLRTTTTEAGEADKDKREKEDVALATAWAPRIKPFSLVFAVVSLGEFLGGIAFLKRSWTPLAWLGCICALLNINHACCLPGAIVGIWGFFSLISNEGRKYFGLPNA